MILYYIVFPVFFPDLFYDIIQFIEKKVGDFMPSTQKLYEEDAFLQNFSAQVLDCQPCKGGWAVVLDATAFYPEGGGQPCDTGTLGGAAVREVHLRDGVIVHLTDAPLSGTVEGAVDWPRRLDHMEQHTGEHILSGMLHRLYGAENVGFHIGEEAVRMDMSLPLTAAQLSEAERLANEAVRADTPVRCHVPASLEGLDYRSKKELEGPVRIVEAGGDVCACCGTHLRTTGQVGAIKILSAQNYKGGVRLAVVCGARAWRAVSEGWEDATAAGRLLSAAPGRLTPAVEHLQTAQSCDKMRLAALQNALAEAMAASVTPGAPCVRLAEGADGDGLRKIAVACVGAGASPALCVSPEGRYALAGDNVQALCRTLNAAFEGRGGGKPNFCQGSFAALPKVEKLEEKLGIRN